MGACATALRPLHALIEAHVLGAEVAGVIEGRDVRVQRHVLEACVRRQLCSIDGIDRRLEPGRPDSMPEPVLAARKRRAVEAIASHLALVKSGRGGEECHIWNVLATPRDVSHIDLKWHEVLIADRHGVTMTRTVDAQIQLYRVLLQLVAANHLSTTRCRGDQGEQSDEADCNKRSCQ